MSVQPADIQARCIRRTGSTWTQCRCPACARRTLRLEKLRRAGVQVLDPQLTSEAGWEVLDHLTGDLRWSSAAVSSATGIPRGTISAILTESRGGRRRDLLQATVRLLIAYGEPSAGRVLACGATRRVRALARVGWSHESLAGMLGVDPGTVRSLASGRYKTTAAVLDAGVRRVWTDLTEKIGPGWRVANHACRDGWAPPRAWDGLDMDDPGLCLVGWPGADAPVLTAAEKERRRQRRESAARVAARKRRRRAVGVVSVA